MGEQSTVTSALHTLSQLQADSQASAERLRAEMEKSLATMQVCKDLQTHIQHGLCCHVLALLKREASLTSQIGLQNPAISTVLEQIAAEADKQAMALMRRFPNLLEHAAEGKIALDAEGRHPRYTIDNGFFTLEVNEQTHIARLSDYAGKLEDIPADPEVLVAAVRREHKRIFDRKFEGTRFLKSLRKEYLIALKASGEADGASVPIRDITRGLKKTQKFREDEFIVDLSRLIEKSPPHIDGRTLDLQQTREAKQGVLLLGANGCGYVGYVVFRKVEV